MRSRVCVAAIVVTLSAWLVPVTGRASDALCHEDVERPGNDNFVDAVAVGDLPFTWSQCTWKATTEDNEPRPSRATLHEREIDVPGRVVSATVWFKLVRSNSKRVAIDTLNASYDTIVTVYDSPVSPASLSSLREVASNDRAFNTKSAVDFAADARREYYIQIGGWGGSAGELEIHFAVAEQLPVDVIVEDFALQAPGAVLRGHVLRPVYTSPTNRRLPVILGFGPYWNFAGLHERPRLVERDGRRVVDDNRDGWQVFLDAGFAYAAVNMRGSGFSSGCINHGGRVDVADARLVIEALAAAPWSNGRVGMVGHSYPAWGAMMGIASGAPALRAVAFSSGVIDLWTLVTRRGAPFTLGPTTQAVGIGWATGAARPQPLNHACPSKAQDWAEAAQILIDGSRTPYFEERDLRPALAGSTVPALIANGIVPPRQSSTNTDADDGEGHISQIEGLWELLDPSTTRFVLGDWAHSVPFRLPQMSWAKRIIAWFDHYLRDGPMRLAPGVVEYQDPDDHWHTTSSWPPPSDPVKLYLDEGLSDQPPSPPSQTAKTFQSGGVPCIGACIANVGRRAPVHACGPDQVLYISPPLAEDVRLAGNAEFELQVTSSLPSGNLVAYLWQTDQDGPCPKPVNLKRPVTRAVVGLRHHANEKGMDFPVAERTKVVLTGYPFAATLKAGNRLVLAVGGDSWELAPRADKPEITITSDQSSLRLPQVEGQVRFHP